MISRLFLFVFSLGLLATVTGCATDEAPERAPSAAQTGVSNIPWNRPEKWEGGSSVPGLGGVPGTR